MGKKFLCFLLVANPISGWLLRVLLNYRFSRKAVNWGYRKLGLLEQAYGRASGAAQSQSYFADYEVGLPAGRGDFVLNLYQGAGLVRSQVVQLTGQPTNFLVQNLVVEPGTSSEISAEIQAEGPAIPQPIKTPIKVQKVSPVRKYPVYSARQAAYENTRGLRRRGLLSFTMSGNLQNPTHLVVLLSDSSAGQDELNESSTVATPQKASQQHLFLEVQNLTFYGEVAQGDLARFQQQLRRLAERTRKRYSVAPESLTVIGLFGASTLAQELAAEFPHASLVISVREIGKGGAGNLSQLLELAKLTGFDRDMSGNSSGGSVHLYCEDDESLGALAKKADLFNGLKDVQLYRLGDTSEATVQAVRLSAWHNTCAGGMEALSEVSGQQLRVVQDGDYFLAQFREKGLTSSAQAVGNGPVVWLLGECSGADVKVLLTRSPDLPYIHYLRKPVHEGLVKLLTFYAISGM